MAAGHKSVRWNRSRTVGGFLLKRLFMLPQHPRQYTPSSVPNPALGPGVFDILVRRCINVGSVSAFFIHGFFLDSFALLQYLINELMIWTRGLAFTLPYDSSLRNPSLLVDALRPSRFRLRLLWGTTTRSESPDPPNEEQRRGKERRIQLGREADASLPDKQFSAQISEEEKRIWNAELNRTCPIPVGSYPCAIACENVKKRWVEQGIWNNKWNQFADGRWKHEEPLELESESETDMEAGPSPPLFSFFRWIRRIWWWRMAKPLSRDQVAADLLLILLELSEP